MVAVNGNGDPRPGRLGGRRAVITGAARGIGAAVARRFAAEGATVAAIDLEPAEDLATAIGGVAIVADLAQPDAGRRAMEEAIDALGGVDVLVNNAGILRITPFLDITIAEWDQLFAVNVRSMLVTTQTAVAAMVSAGQPGTIVNMASMGAKSADAGQAHYAASKAAVVALTQVVAKEFGHAGITANSICPGFVPTDMGATTRTPEMESSWAALSPLGRLASTDDVAAMAAFLASDDAAYCTGQAFHVNGGMLVT